MRERERGEGSGERSSSYPSEPLEGGVAGSRVSESDGYDVRRATQLTNRA
jgi:hypothetical protein